MTMEGAELSSFNGAYSVNEEADFMAQLFHNSTKIESSNSELLLSCIDNSSSLYYLPFQAGTYSLTDASVFFPVEYCPRVSKQHYVQQFLAGFPIERDDRSSLEASSGGSFRDQQTRVSDNENLMLKQDCDQISESEAVAADGGIIRNGRKRCRVFPEEKRIMRTKKKQKVGSDIDDNSNGDHPDHNIRNNSSSCLEEECSGSQDMSGVASSSMSSKGIVNGKTRASRGAATDPQSLYARKRRERINERLRILQNLVPNGTKVDISTMLEEAVHYVKFLQLQIKLLSSDELWMYAPLAYNGVDIGLDSKIRAL